jgi:hypothetical protein
MHDKGHEGVGHSGKDNKHFNRKDHRNNQH